MLFSRAIVRIARRLLPPVPRTFAVPDIQEISQVRCRAAIAAPASMRAGPAELLS